MMGAQLTNEWDAAFLQIGRLHFNAKVMEVAHRLNQAFHILEQSLVFQRNELPSVLQPSTI